MPIPTSLHARGWRVARGLRPLEISRWNEIEERWREVFA